MILTRRGLVAGTLANAVGGFASCPVEAADPELVVDAVEGSLVLRADGPLTPVLRYGTAEPALVLRARQGREAVVRVRNRLPRPTSFRLCGLRGLGSLDGPGTIPVIAPGAEATLRFTPADSGTAWFRPLFDGADQAVQGLVGILVVDPAGEGPAVDQDLALLLRDWRLDVQKPPTPAEAAGATVITLGNRPLPAAFSARPGARLRLRLVNGSVARVMVVACEGARPSIVAIDGQPSELFAPIRDTVPIGPGSRFDLLVDLPRTAGQGVRLVLRGSEKVGNVLELDRLLCTITTGGEPVDPRPPIGALPANPALPPAIRLEASKRAELTIAPAGAGWTVNGVSGRDWPAKPVLRVRQGDAVTLGFINAGPMLLPLSLYGQAMRLLHPADDGWEPYWRDTVLLPPGSRNHVAFVADTPGRWPIESGFADQAVAGLRCWFEVTRA